MENKKWSKGTKITLIALSALIVLVIGISISGDGQLRDEKEATQIEAMKQPPVYRFAGAIESAYSLNEISADKEFKNKFVKVEGVIDDIKKTSEGADITLRGHKSGILCKFPGSDLSKIENVQRGDRITVTGIFTDWNGFGTMIKCDIVPNELDD